MAAGGVKPWLSEPDSWLHIDDDGLVLAAVRAGVGWWRGYLGIHKAMDHNRLRGIRAHGGLTYKKAESPGSLTTTMLMALSVSGYEMPVFWIGFDCGHRGDMVPQQGWIEVGIYRDLEFVRGEIQRMADQVRALEAVSA